jgi:hypothetical protein
MNKLSVQNLRQHWPLVLEVIWTFVLLALPISSFTMLARLTGALTAPLSALPVLFLLLFYCLPYILRGGSLPRESLLLVVFILVAVLSSAAAYFIDIPSFKGKTVFDQELRSIFTLAIGVSFYFVFAIFPNSAARMRKSWQWINLGGALALSWSLVQGYFIYRQAAYYPGWIQAVQDFFVIPSPNLTLWNQRVNGFTYEASWFAHQMVMLYLPLWFAATFQGTSAYKYRLWRISVENILLVVGILSFFLTSPRVGLLSFVLMVGYLFILANLRLLRRISRMIAALPVLQRNPARRPLQFVIVGLLSLLYLGFYIGVLSAIIYVSMQRDWRLSLLLETTLTPEELWGALTMNEYVWMVISLRLAFMERMTYWIAGWHIFQLFPLLGVGLGNAGFFFPTTLPALGWASFEVRNVLYRIKAFPNIKSLWVRLLAETGVVGFAVFAAWLYVLFRSALLSYRSQDPLIKTLALAGQLCIIALLAEGFSIDSFALPYLWVTLGLLSAAGFLYRQELQKQLHI